MKAPAVPLANEHCIRAFQTSAIKGKMQTKVYKRESFELRAIWKFAAFGNTVLEMSHRGTQVSHSLGNSKISINGCNNRIHMLHIKGKQVSKPLSLLGFRLLAATGLRCCW